MKEHNVGDFVTYKQNGICKIKGIVKENFGILGEKEYYQLTPVYDEKTVVFVPVDSPLLSGEMRHILSAEEIDAIIALSDSEDDIWVTDVKERARIFGEILNSGDRAKILRIIKELSLYKLKLEESKKKLYASDMKVLTAAQKAICEEFSFVLNIKREEVLPYILKTIEEKKK